MTDEQVQQERDEAVSTILMAWHGDPSLPTIRAALELAYTTGRRDELNSQVVRLERKVSA